MKNYKITIPKPCHEDWNAMTPKEKGRFCSSCAKTVVDFTEKSKKEIQDFFNTNKNKKVCGHFNRKQLDSIVIQIPESVFTINLSHEQLFIILLFFVMGTTLFSCKTETKIKQKIDKVELVDTIIETKQVIDTLDVKTKSNCSSKVPSISLSNNISQSISKTLGEPIAKSIKPLKDEMIEVEGETIIEMLGDIDIVETGDVVAEHSEEVYKIYIVDKPAQFKGTRELSREKLVRKFDKHINKYVNKNFDVKTSVNLGLKSGKHKIFGRFKINKQGNVFDVQAKASHLLLEKHLEEILNKLPQFIPAQHNQENVVMSYVFPVVFIVE